MSQRKRLTREMLRILRAAREGRLYRASQFVGRWQIEGEQPPVRRDRELLQKRGLLKPSDRVGTASMVGLGPFTLGPTELGREALRDI